MLKPLLLILHAVISSAAYADDLHAHIERRVLAGEHQLQGCARADHGGWFRYSMRLHKVGPSGTALSQQGSGLLLSPGETGCSGTLSINVDEGDRYRLLFQLREGRYIVAEEWMEYPEH